MGRQVEIQKRLVELGKETLDNRREENQLRQELQDLHVEELMKLAGRFFKFSSRGSTFFSHYRKDKNHKNALIESSFHISSHNGQVSRVEFFRSIGVSLVIGGHSDNILTNWTEITREEFLTAYTDGSKKVYQKLEELTAGEKKRSGAYRSPSAKV